MHNLFGNSTSHARWHVAPDSRGTWTILSSCMTTLILCSWATFRLNIEQGTPRRKMILKKAAFVTLGLFFPDMIAWLAYTEYVKYRRLDKAMNKIFGITPPPSLIQWLLRRFRRKSNQESQSEASPDEGGDSNDAKSEPAIPWSAVHSRYAVMGGFIVEAGDDPAENFFPNWARRLTLTPYGVQMLADLEPGALPKIPVQQIEDKSKMSSFVGAVVCSQVVWFLFQLIARLATGSTISLLELNTFVNAVALLVTYCLWSNKPLDVQEPTVINVGRAKEVFALMVMTTGSEFGDKFIAGFEHMEPCKSDHKFEWYTSKSRFLLFWYPEAQLGRWGALNDGSEISNEVPGQLSYLDKAGGFQVGSNRCSFLLEPPDVLRLQLAETAMGKYNTHPAFRNYVCFRQDYYQYNLPCRCKADKLAVRLENVPRSVANLYATEWDWHVTCQPNIGSLQIGNIIAATVYGGLHLLAWKAPFPTATQQFLWRFCSIALAASAFVLLVIILLTWLNIETSAFIIRKLDLQLGTWKRTAVKRTEITLNLFLFWIYVMYYVFCRSFLIVECFVSLAHLPDSGYKAPSWANVVPHMS